MSNTDRIKSSLQALENELEFRRRDVKEFSERIHARDEQIDRTVAFINQLVIDLKVE